MSLWIHNTNIKTPPQFLVAISRPYPIMVVGTVLSVIIAEVSGTLAPFALKKIIDAFTLEQAALGAVVFWACAYVGLNFVLSPAFYRISGLFGMRWQVGLRATATDLLSSYVTRHSTEYFSRRFAGAIGGKIGNAAQAAKNIAENLVWQHLIFLVSLITTLILVFSSHALLGSVFIAWLMAAIPLNIYLARKRITLSAEAQKQDTRVRARIIDLLTNIIAMHDFARRDHEMRGVKGLIMERYRAGIRNWTFGETVRSVNDVLQFFFVSAVIGAVVYLWSVGAATPGDVVLVLTLLIGLQQQVSQLGNSINQFAEHYGEVKEGLEEIFHPHEIQDVPGAPPLVATNGAIVFEKVSFRYAHADIFSNLSLAIAPGSRVGLVGRSGAGKSTFMKLLTRGYDVTGGKICIDDQNIAFVTQESVRDAIPVVPQEPLLFHRSILENIRYGRLDASADEVREAARLAQADSFIEKLPEGYDTLVGERGIKLSGGERQRVALARAFLKRAKILLLDEATSALDSENEALIQSALERLMEGKTVIAIAHRLSTLRAMDRVLVFDEGKIIEDGSHDELIALGGVYAELWARQAGGFLKDE